MMPNKSIYRDADAAEINLYELNFARFFSIQTSENGWRRVVCELVRRAAKGTKELRLEDGTELPGEKTFPDYVVDLMDSYLAVLPDAKPHAYPAAEREQLTSSLVMQMIQKTSLEELKQMGHTYLNYVRRNSSKNPLEDWKQAVNYYYAGAAQGDAECAAAVGYCCEMDPRGSNLPLALAWYQHAAKAGSAWAMEKVATFYEEGYGCTANRALADACRETLKYMR